MGDDDTYNVYIYYYVVLHTSYMYIIGHWLSSMDGFFIQWR